MLFFVMTRHSVIISGKIIFKNLKILKSFNFCSNYNKTSNSGQFELVTIQVNQINKKEEFPVDRGGSNINRIFFSERLQVIKPRLCF